MCYKVIKNLLILYLCISISYKASGFVDANKSPIKITSENLKISYSENIAEYIGNVLITQESIKRSTLKISCNKMIIYYKKTTQQTHTDTSIEKIDFIEKVTINEGNKVAQGDKGYFDSKSKLIILTGKVALKEENQYMEGQKVTYNTETKLFKMIGNNKSNDRVRILIEDN